MELLQKQLHEENRKLRLKSEKIPVISRNLFHGKVYQKNYKIKKDLRILNKGQISIITRLRTEHIQLNYYYHKRNHYKYYQKQYNTYGYIKEYKTCKDECCKQYNEGKCIECKQWETVYHYLFECKVNFMLRTKMIMDIRNILNLYNHNLCLDNVLFPPINMQWNHRKQIFNGITNYVNKTHRLPW